MRIAASIPVRTLAQALDLVERAAGIADLVELRLDRCGAAIDLQELIASVPLPVLAACPLSSEGGGWTRGPGDRADLLTAAARAGAAWVDLPLGAPIPALPVATRIVRSWHEVPGEGGGDLLPVLRCLEAELRPGDVAKLVAWAADHDSASRVLPLYRHARAPLIAFAMGPGGRATRAWAPVLGAPWTYAAVDSGAATAPGQWTAAELAGLWPPGGAAPGTGLFAVVGRPAAHSLSPILWNTAFRLSGLDAFYLALEPAGDLAGLLASHRQRAFQAFSVTAPFKEEAAALADACELRVRGSGAANTLRRDGERWVAHATDGPAALECLAAAGLRPAAPLILLGAGGAARCVLLEALLRGHPTTVAARRPAAASAMVEDVLQRWSGGPRPPVPRVAALGALRIPPGAGIVQATPVGSAHLPGNLLEGCSLPAGAVVLDMVYRPARTALLRQAAAAGAAVIPGHRLLVRQMRLQFRVCTGLDVSEEALVRTVEAALQRHGEDAPG